MITAVIDTNVFVSALITGGTPLQALETVRTGLVQLLITTQIEAEIENTLTRAKFAPYFQRQETKPQKFLANYTTIARYMSPVQVLDCPIEDKKDLMLIECAVAGQADYIVSGDHHLLDLGYYKNITILRPAHGELKQKQHDYNQRLCHLK